MVDCGQLNISVAPLTSRHFSTCTLFLFRPAGLAARLTSVRLSPRLCLFIPSPPSIFCPVQTSAPVVSCHHHACTPTSVCLCTCRTPAGANLPACLHTCMYPVVHFVTWLTALAQKPCWSSEQVEPSFKYDSASAFSFRCLIVFVTHLLCVGIPEVEIWHSDCECKHDFEQCSPAISSCTPVTRPLFFTGVKRGVCSQINHFPEDADFDHDGAEYVLRKSTLQQKPMNNKADDGQTFSHNNGKHTVFFT